MVNIRRQRRKEKDRLWKICREEFDANAIKRRREHQIKNVIAQIGKASKPTENIKPNFFRKIINFVKNIYGKSNKGN